MLDIKKFESQISNKRCNEQRITQNFQKQQTKKPSMDRTLQSCIFLKSLGASNMGCLFTVQPQTLFSWVSIFYRFIAYDAKTTIGIIHLNTPVSPFASLIVLFIQPRSIANGFLILYQFVQSCCHFPTGNACCPCTTYSRYVVK